LNPHGANLPVKSYWTSMYRHRQAVALDPSLILPGDRPRLIDEWQLAPEIWNHVRRAVDDEDGPGRFILTGSAVPADDDVRHTGAGRFSRLRMRPMSLFEAGTSSGNVSLAGLLAADQTRAADPGLGILDIAEEVVRGGWPGWRDLSISQSIGSTRDYIEQVCRTDVSAVDGVSRDP
jgi:predicted AAA+ superfamily ATPase